MLACAAHAVLLAAACGVRLLAPAFFLRMSCLCRPRCGFVMASVVCAAACCNGFRSVALAIIFVPRRVQISASLQYSSLLFSWGSFAPLDTPEKPASSRPKNMKNEYSMLEIFDFGSARHRLYGGFWGGSRPPREKYIFLTPRPKLRDESVASTRTCT